MKVFGWQADFSGCAWYRLILPLGALRQQGVEVEWNRKIEDVHGDFDVIVAQRSCLPGPTKILQGLSKLSKRPKLVMELDDDLLHIDRHNKTAEGFYGDAQIRANLVANLRAVDMVTVSTEPLADLVRKYNSNVTVLPNCIPRGLLTWNPGFFSDRLTIGWQGSPTHDGDWKPASEPVRRWFDRAKRSGLGVEMHTIGRTPDTFPSVYPHRSSGWRDSMDDYYRLMDWHIALAPLAPTIFNDSKSHIRVLEAAALGFPVVASDVTAYREFVQHGHTGFLVRKPTDWARHLQALAADPDMRTEMSTNARRYAAQFAIEDQAQRWLEVYQQ